MVATIGVIVVMERIPRRKRMEDNGSNLKEKSDRSGVGMKAGIVIVLVLAVGAVLYMKGQKPASPPSTGETVPAAQPDSA